MSVFVYKCFSCETYQDVSHGMTESPEIKCECGEKMERVMQPVSFIGCKGMYAKDSQK